MGYEMSAIAVGAAACNEEDVEFGAAVAHH